MVTGCAGLDKALSPRERAAERVTDPEAIRAIRALDERWEQEPVPVGLKRQVFYDDALVRERTEGVVRHLGDVTKKNDGRHVFELAEWEYTHPGYKDGVRYASVLYDEGLFKIWYQYDGNVGRLGYAESMDGYTWDRGHGGFFRPDLKSPVHGPCVIRDPHDSRRGHRYKMVHGMGTGFGSRYLHGLTFARSSSGLSWRDYGEPHPLDGVRSDTGNALMWDETIQRYRVTTRLGDVRGGRGYVQFVRPHIDVGVLRSVGHALFVPTARPWQRVDEHRLPETRQQLYALYMQKYESIYIAYVNVFEGGKNEFYIAFSRSGTNWDWSWIHDRERFIETGSQGAFDEFGHMHVSSPIITKGDEHLIFFTGRGWPRAQAGRMPLDEEGPERALGIASVRLDGLAYLENDEGQGRVTTKRFRLEGRRLEVNVAAGLEREGESSALRVGILDREGRPVRGYTSEDCDPVRSDGLHTSVSWRGSADLSALQGKEIQLAFDLDGPVRLYAFQVLP